MWTTYLVLNFLAAIPKSNKKWNYFKAVYRIEIRYISWKSIDLCSLVFQFLYLEKNMTANKSGARSLLPDLLQFSSVQLSCSVLSDSLWPHESQHTRPPCPSPTPRVHSNSWTSSRWCHPAISSSVVPFSSCPQSLPASESFSMSQLFTWGG